MSLGDRLGFAGLLVAVIGVGLVYLWPDKRWIGWVCVGIAALLATGWGTLELKQKLGDSSTSLCLSIALGGIFGALAAASIWQSAKTQEQKSPLIAQTPKPEEKPPTLEELFKSDFPSMLKIGHENVARGPTGDTVNLKNQIYVDFASRVKFVGFYVPRSPQTYDVCLSFWTVVQSTLAQKQVQVTGGYKGEQNSLDELTFSGRVMIYHDDFLSIIQKAEIIKLFAAHGFDVNFRGPDYLGDQVITWHQKHDTK